LLAAVRLGTLSGEALDSLSPVEPEQIPRQARLVASAQGQPPGWTAL
jgi:hypothetical protein